MGGVQGAASGIARGRWLNNLASNSHDPFVLQKLDGTCPLLGIPGETPIKEVDTLFAKLICAWQLWRVSLCNVIHNGPFIVQVGPRPPTSSHLKDNAAKRPYVNCSCSAWVLAFDDFWGHIHGGSGHRPVGLGAAVDKRLALPGDDLGCSKVDVLDDTIVIEQDVCEFA